MLGRSLASALVVAAVLTGSASAQVADSNGGGLRLAAEARSGAAEFAVPLHGLLESNFGYRWGRLHAGLDIAVLGTDRVRAALGGVVTKIGYQAHYAGYGNIVAISHGRGLSTLYAHLDGYSVRVGSVVARGEPIGTAGCTGSCTGEHLHFEVRVKGKPVNPMRFLSATPRPLQSRS